MTATARTTREQVWAPPATPRRERLRHCSRHMLVGTLAVTLLFAVGPPPGAPVHNHDPAALVLFILWATLQQVLFHFYLLGRLRALSPAGPAPALATFNGLLFGADPSATHRLAEWHEARWAANPTRL